MDISTAIDEAIRHLEGLISITGRTWYGGGATLALRAAKKAKAIATNDYKTLWEMECEDSAAAKTKAAEVEGLYQDARQESMRLYRRLLQYEGEEPDPNAHLAKAGGIPPPLVPTDVWRFLGNRNSALVAQPAPEPKPLVPVDDDLYE